MCLPERLLKRLVAFVEENVVKYECEFRKRRSTVHIQTIDCEIDY